MTEGMRSAGPVAVNRHRSGVVELLLDAAERGNALDLDAAEALREAAGKIAADPGRAVLLRGAGRNFCVGGDLRAFAVRGDQTAAYVGAVAGAAHAAVELLYALPVPVVTAVQGAAAGAGIGLALLGDLVLAARSATFRLAYTAVGLSPDCGASWLLPRVVGEKRAADLLLTNRVLPAAEAENWGLVSRAVDDDDLCSEGFALAAALAGRTDEAAPAVKRLIRGGAGGTSLHDHLAAEARSIAALAGTGPTRSSMRAFLDAKRTPSRTTPPPVRKSPSS